MRTGVYPAAVTPHRREGHEADFGAMLELVDFLSRGPVQGICLLGPAGEFLNIKYSDRVRLLHLAVKRSRVPVIAGVSHSTLDGSVELAAEAISSGASGLLLMPPYFFRYEQAEVLEFYTQFSAEVGRSVPVLIYNLPQFTTLIEIETVRTLLASGRFAGIVDGGGDSAYFANLLDLQKAAPFALFSAEERRFAAARRAGASILSAAAGVVPEIFLELDNAINQGLDARVDLLDCRLREFTTWIERFPEPVAVKAAITMRKLKTGPMTVPLSPEKAAMLEEFRKWFLPWFESLNVA